MIKKKNNLIITIIFIFITIAIILYRDLVKNNISFLIFSIVCLLNALLTNQAGRMMYITALLPFCRGIPYSEMILITLLIDIIVSITLKKFKINLKYIIPIVLILVIESINYLYYDIFSDKILYLCLYMFFVTYVLSNNSFANMEKKVIWLYSISTCIAILSVVIREINLYGIEHIFSYNIRFGANIEDLTVTNFNSNELGLYCLVAVSLLLVMYNKTKNIFSIIFAILLSILGIVSISRTYLIFIIIVWFIYSLFSKGRVFLFILIIILFYTIIMSLHYVIPDFIDWIFGFINERNETLLSDGLSGRFKLMTLYFGASFKNVWTILFGYSQNYLSLCNISEAVHNGIQEILVCWGIFGMVVAMYWLIILYKQPIKRVIGRKKNKIVLLPMVIFILFIQTIQLFTMNCYLIVMLLTIITITIREDDISEIRIEEKD